ncbi:MAG: flagellar basal body rod protein FlgB, partial [Alphaproteobacteria bacterium TMED199]
MDTIKDQISFYSSALQLRGKRNNILASNIANAATPNYKARDINFLDEFKKVTNTGEIKTTHSNHIPTKNYNISGKALYRDPI